MKRRPKIGGLGPLFLAALAWPILAVSAEPIALRLDAVTESDSRGYTSLRIESRARFLLEAVARTIRSNGAWTAQRTIGPQQLARYTHKFEDFSIEKDGRVRFRSYECVEGTFGAELLAANVCRNYQFGPNGRDEGGYGDDVLGGSPMDFRGYAAESVDWDGEKLVVRIVPDRSGPAPVTATSIELVLTFIRE